MTTRATLRSLGLGRFVYQYWHRPIGWVQAIIAAGGPLEIRRTEAGRQQMEIAARTLPELPAAPGAALSVHLLTGKKYWYQTAFCLWSLARQSQRRLAPVIYDDGTLAPEYCEPLTRLFPDIRFVAKPETIARLEEHLPASRFPVLRDRWQMYPHIRKLLDVHVGQQGWKLVIDSDLIFFNRPQFLINWLDNPALPLHAVDCETAYGYPRSTINELAGAPVAELVNVGLTGLNSSHLDWDRLESWSRALIERHGTHYFLEQSLVAMLLAGRDCAIAPAADYITNPDEAELIARKAVMHHYVADVKKWYFRHGWQAALKG